MSGAPGGPFPIDVLFTATAGASCDHIDISALTLAASVPLQPAAARSPAMLPPGVPLEVTSCDLPASVCTGIACHIARCSTKQGSRGTPTEQLLAALSAALQLTSESLLELLMLAPAAFEVYEAVTADGASQRRLKFTAETEGSASTDTATASVLTPALEQGSESSGGVVSPALAQELRRCRRRFKGLSETPETEGGPPVTAVAYQLLLTPSDPAWQVGALPVSGRVSLSAPLAKPGDGVTPLCIAAPEKAADRMDVTLSVEMCDAVTAAAAAMVNKMLSRQASAASGAPLMTAQQHHQPPLPCHVPPDTHSSAALLPSPLRSPLLPQLRSSLPSGRYWQSAQKTQQSDVCWGCTWSNVRTLLKSGLRNISGARALQGWLAPRLSMPPDAR